MKNTNPKSDILSSDCVFSAAAVASAGVTYCGGGLPLASHWIFTVWSKGSAIMGPGEEDVMVGGCSTRTWRHNACRMIT